MLFKRTAIAAAAALATGLMVATPARAEPGDNPCDLAITFLCQFVPVAPDLDHDLDLTQQQPPADPNAPPPDSLPAVDPCSAGCV